MKRSARESSRLLAANWRQKGEVCLKAVKRSKQGFDPLPLWIAHGQLKNTVAHAGCGQRFEQSDVQRFLVEVRDDRARRCPRFLEGGFSEGWLSRSLCHKQAPLLSLSGAQERSGRGVGWRAMPLAPAAATRGASLSMPQRAPSAALAARRPREVPLAFRGTSEGRCGQSLPAPLARTR